MPQKRPVFLFTFANDAQGSLRVGEEQNACSKALAGVHDRGLAEYFSAGYATLNSIYDALDRFNDRTYIFHYAGHSDNQGLQLTDTVGRVESMATILGRQKKLKLVFLNGCANAKQVEILWGKGVKAVIATSADVEDQRALHLADRFYQALASGQTIKDAFDTAASFVKNDSKVVIDVFRGIRLEKNQIQDFPWGLYVKDESVLNWSIEDFKRNNTSFGDLVEQRREQENISVGNDKFNTISRFQNRIFLCHASEDKEAVILIYQKLRIAGFRPWLDKMDLLPGQDWNKEIRKALKKSRFVIIFFSKHSVSKRGYVQREFKLALDTLEEIPEGQVFVIPVRLDDCKIPEAFNHLHYVNLFDQEGFVRVIKVILEDLEEVDISAPPKAQEINSKAGDFDFDLKENSSKSGKNETAEEDTHTHDANSREYYKNQKSKFSYLSSKASEYQTPLHQISDSPYAIEIYKNCLDAIIKVFDDPENNLAETLSADFLNNAVRRDVAQIRMDLKNYKGSKLSRNDVRTAKEYLDIAVSQISVLAKHFRKESKNIQEEADRLELLDEFQKNLAIALQYLS